MEEYDDPLYFLMKLMNNKSLPVEVRLEAAIALMPFFHAPFKNEEEE